ncbi:hypothetical protein BBK14_08615 [Parafrankia soli]|uniref:Uncharacterized protein n=1 Tax=Parafrankia soli TaxID=2599596 RepID=A0A1S1PGE6_9ACTN|nr:hypothetical protein [Parafrankia soli]OHV20281.1 hypothetical protein BBK14_08615 [Parafrankia soli]
MFRNHQRRRPPREKQITALLRGARDAGRGGDLHLAIAFQSSAGRLARVLHAQSPGDVRGAQLLGGVLYDLAALLHRAGSDGEAIRALEDSERAYATLAGRVPAAGGWISDVYARRAVLHAQRGCGASALADAQAALRARHVLDGADGADGPDEARTLALGSDVLGAFGDPDMAVAAADRAVRGYLSCFGPAGVAGPGLPRTSPHVGYLARACRVAAVIRQARGAGEEGRAARLAAAAANLGASAPATVLERRFSSPNPPDLATGLEDALRVVPRCGGDGRRAELLRAALVRARADRTALTWYEGVTVDAPETTAGTATGATMGMGPPGVGGLLARLATAVLPTDAAAGMRLALEAHRLRAGAPAARSGRAHADDAAWAEVLLTASRQVAGTGDTLFALDLAAWAARATQAPADTCPAGAIDGLDACEGGPPRHSSRPSDIHCRPDLGTGAWEALPC